MKKEELIKNIRKLRHCIHYWESGKSRCLDCGSSQAEARYDYIYNKALKDVISLIK